MKVYIIDGKFIYENEVNEGVDVTSLVEVTHEQLQEMHDTNNGIVNSRNYLASTDWYYARKMETGEAVPTEVVTKRLEAREVLRSKGY